MSGSSHVFAVGSGSAVYAGSTGTFGPRGATGLRGPPSPPEKCLPIKVVARLDTELGKVEIRVKASVKYGWAITSQVQILVWLVGHDGTDRPISTTETTSVYSKEPEAMASETVMFLEDQKIGSISKEELSALFTVARKEGMKMVCTLFAELHVGQLSREEMAEAWDDANALSVMSE